MTVYAILVLYNNEFIDYYGDGFKSIDEAEMVISEIDDNLGYTYEIIDITI